ncbi:hypothetical protein [Vreelandella massiliensis]|uniref:hypothetical protein n=1 Tax=Vreelandella massiliensis TaxID=1816686 RepID=UPI00096AABE2|nr:hypothetical protein [Halomonas massiliensis]
MSKHPIFKLSAGLVMGVLGGIMLISSGVLLAGNMKTIAAYFDNRMSSEELAQLPQTPADSCVKQLDIMGFSAAMDGRHSVEVAPEGIADTEMPVELASAAAAACSGYELTHFCMGADCEGGLEMRLESAGKEGSE